MAEPDKPVEKVICLISLLAKEQCKVAEIPSVGGILSRVFGGLTATGAPGTIVEGGEQQVFSDWQQQPLDHSTVPALLRKIEEMHEQRRAAEEKHLQGSERVMGYDYRIGDCLRVWIGTENQFETHLARQAGIREKGAKMLLNAEVTAENITAVLKNFNTAETVKARQDAIDTAISRATAAPDAVKPMKRLKIKKPD